MTRRTSLGWTAVLGAGLGLALLAAGPAAAQDGGTVEIFKPDGSLQCSLGSGFAPEQMAIELTGAEIEVVSSRKATDGLVHIAQCGTPTGQVNVYEIAEGDLPAAQDMGFARCPAGDAGEGAACAP